MTRLYVINVFLLGDKFAHLSLARCYNKGVAVEQSFEKSFEHYKAGAEAGVLL